MAKTKTWQAKLADRYYRSQCQRLGAEWSVRKLPTSREGRQAFNLAEDAKMNQLIANAYNGSNR